MLNQLLKFTLVSSLLLWLRPRWKSLLTLVVAVLLVHMLHGEYLGYVQLSGDDAFLVWSYALKWLALALIAGGYIAFLMLGSRGSKPAGKRGTRSVTPTQGEPRGAKALSSAQQDDGFDFLRDKKHLSSRADQVIASKPK